MNQPSLVKKRKVKIPSQSIKFFLQTSNIRIESNKGARGLVKFILRNQQNQQQRINQIGNQKTSGFPELILRSLIQSEVGKIHKSHRNQMSESFVESNLQDKIVQTVPRCAFLSYKNSEVDRTLSPKLLLSPTNSKTIKLVNSSKVQRELDETKEKLEITLEVNNLLRLKINKLETSINENKKVQTNGISNVNNISNSQKELNQKGCFSDYKSLNKQIEELNCENQQLKEIVRTNEEKQKKIMLENITLKQDFGELKSFCAECNKKFQAIQDNNEQVRQTQLNMLQLKKELDEYKLKQLKQQKLPQNNPMNENQSANEGENEEIKKKIDKRMGEVIKILDSKQCILDQLKQKKEQIGNLVNNIKYIQ